MILVSAERVRDFPQNLPLATNRGPVYLLGTGESVETPMINPIVIPAKAGIQEPRVPAVAPCSSQGRALDPRLRVGDEIIITSSRAFHIAGAKAYAETGISTTTSIT